MSSRSRDAAYWRRRIEREFPAIAERLRTGEITSVRAAAMEAGLIHEPSPLLQLRRAWRKASPADRAAFMADVAVRELAQQPFAIPHQRRGRLVVHGNAADDTSAAPLPLEAPAQAARPTAVLKPTGTLTEHDPAEGAPPAPPKTLKNLDIPAMGEGVRPVISVTGELDRPEEKPRSGVRRLWGLVAPSAGQGESRKSGSSGNGSSGVKVGDLYRKVDAGPAAWSVLSLFAGPHGVPHARIASVEEPDTVRTVSIAALTDASRYQRVG